MPELVSVRYVGPFDEVDVFMPHGRVRVRNGDTIDVPADVAGVAPDGDDLGSGLLAQTDNWTPAPPAKKERG